ncbi:CoA transferase [Sphingobium sp.]|uniref:CoA transferase n=1 Tax=Sphingobium sp. TaxID=1912891 RepID=UPI002BEB0EB9|nr:CoA transferase [Sphingobium sp.]HUD89974.1 CoA transferase [Sphingobium sp.]
MPIEVTLLALRHARSLLHALGMPGDPTPKALHPALAWRRAGLMAVTGRADGPGLVAPVALSAAADGTLAALRAIAPQATLPDSGSLLLGERARLLGLRRRGRISANGSCRLISARGGRMALNLARPDDWDLVPALLGQPATDWDAIERIAAGQARDDLFERGQLLGLPIALDEAPPAPALPFAMHRLGEGRIRTRLPLVIDLSSLWAGPLAGSLLVSAGARVVKVESLHRPDGARSGDPRFFDLLNGGKYSIALDFTASADVARLGDLVAAADIVIEGSRPRALAQIGIDAEEKARRGATWISITAHGREGAAADRVGFGDDAAAAGGLSAAMARGWNEPLFAGDAISDPLTGLVAALAAWAGWRQGGGLLIDVPMARTVAHGCALYEATPEELRDWQALANVDQAQLDPMRAAAGVARPLGADHAMLRMLAAS